MENPQDTAVYLCQDSVEGILTAVYDAWASGRGHSHVRLKLDRPDTLELFCTYITTMPDPEKAEKVRRSTARKISGEAWEIVYRALLSSADSKADDVYRFLVLAFRHGPKITRMMAEPAVLRLHELNRAVGNESHYYKEFLRFDALEKNLLFARIRPKNNVLTLVSPHFADRLPEEDFLILDVGRSLAAVHPAGRPWFLSSLSAPQAEALLTGGDEYRALWQVFFDTVAIRERENYVLQRGNMPLHYREFTPEHNPAPGGRYK